MTALKLSWLLDKARATLKGFARDRRGVSAVEFALILPFMVALYLGGTALTQGIIIKRKVVMVTHTVGDLVARDNILTNAEVTAIFDAAKAVFAPYAWNTLLKIKVSQVIVDANGAAKVEWGEAFQDTAHAANFGVTLPPGLNTPNSWVIWTEVSYEYNPVIGDSFTGGPVTLKDQLYIRPRLTSFIKRDP